jgi:hypothetical protein
MRQTRHLRMCADHPVRTNASTDFMPEPVFSNAATRTYLSMTGCPSVQAKIKLLNFQKASVI